MGDISRELVWRRWFQIGRRNLLSGLPLTKLRVLELYEKDYGEHHLEELWGETNGEAPLQLRQLLISGCYNFQGFPKSIGHLNHLKKIVITKGYSVRSLPEEFCLLQSLEHLVLAECRMLSSLPTNFGNLSNLRHLNLSYCKELRRLPNTSKNLKLLEYLDLDKCSQFTFTLEEDFKFLEKITKLEYLNLSRCKQLEELPHHITNQASLKELYFYKTRLRKLPDNIGQLSRLTEMRVAEVQLTSLPTSLGDLSSLTDLKITYCPKLQCLPDSLRDLSSLTKLEVFFNQGLKEIEALPRTLKAIYLEHYERLRDIPSFAGFTSLRCFSLRNCDGIKKIEGLENCTRLEELSVDTCWEVPGIESLEHLQNLKRLALKANKRSVIEHCIQTIQKWPDEIVVCARAVPAAASLVHSSLSPNLLIVDSISNRRIMSWPKLVLKGIPDDDVIMFCCVINCVTSRMTLDILLDGPISFHSKVGRGRWALVGVVRECSCDGELKMGEGELEKGLVVRGDEQTVREAVRSLLPLFSL